MLVSSPRIEDPFLSESKRMMIAAFDLFKVPSQILRFLTDIPKLLRTLPFSIISKHDHIVLLLIMSSRLQLLT